VGNRPEGLLRKKEEEEEEEEEEELICVYCIASILS
jgi:hypothetical protein